jgi:hypothetical protein
LAGNGVAGCAGPAEDTGSSGQELGVDVPNPSGAYFANVTANGTGCPAGTWDAGISDDGKAFTVTFSGYETTVTPGQAFAIKDCTLSIDLRTPEGFSFSVSSFHYQGYATLDQPGMSAKQTAKYYFQGNPVPAKELRSDMAGPYDDSYVFSDDVGVADLVWSPCGASRTLEAQTRLVLQNNTAKTGSGYLNTSSVDGEVKTVLRFNLSWKKCGGDSNVTVPVQRAYNGSIGDHLQGLTAGEGAPAYRYEGVGFSVYAEDGTDRQPIFRCRYKDGPFHFISNSDGCEGHTNEGRLGFVSKVAKPGLVPISRCYHEGASDHLTTTNPDECRAAGFRVEGGQGFAVPGEGIVSIHRAYNGSIGDHLQGLTAHEGEPAYSYEGIGFRIYAAGAADRAPIYRCRYNGGPFHFISNSANCEGHTSEGQLGFVNTVPKPGLVPISRCYHEGASDHLTTTNPDECRNAGFRVEGGQGFALP